jgi:rusticyanin
MPRTAERKHSVISTNLLLLVIVILLLVVIIILLLGYGLGFGMMNGLSGMMGTDMFSGMMGGSSTSGTASMMVGMMGQVGTPIAVQTAVQDMKAMQSYAIDSPKNNSISFGSKNVSIVVLAMGVDRAVNLTNSTPPAYAKNDTFVIDGLINPTLVLQKGSTVHITFVNLDSSEYHDIIITSTGPPYQYMPMSAMGGLVSMMSFVQHADYQQGQAYEYSYNASFNSAGTFWYLCMYPGHAQMGMYGKIIVE